MSKAQAIKTLAADWIEANELCERYAIGADQNWENGRAYWRFDDGSVLVFDDVSFWVS